MSKYNDKFKEQAVRKAIKNRKVFPTAQSAIKVVYLAIQAAAKKWRACPTKRFGYDAHSSLEECHESFYDRVSRPDSGTVLSWAVTQNYLQARS